MMEAQERFALLPEPSRLNGGRLSRLVNRKQTAPAEGGESMNSQFFGKSDANEDCGASPLSTESGSGPVTAEDCVRIHRVHRAKPGGAGGANVESKGRSAGRSGFALGTVRFPHRRTLSHCGTDALHLVRSNGNWQVVGLSYTVQTAGCSGPAR